ncbi:MAG: hypothetical protein V3U96_05855 [Paracoccaceae bacterium]
MVLSLRLDEPVVLDKNRLAEIIARLGPRGADEVISRTMEELAVQLAKVHKASASGKHIEINRAAQKIMEYAAHVGMPTLSAAAANVVTYQHPGTASALAAIIARLERTGEASLMQVWDLQDLSM